MKISYDAGMVRGQGVVEVDGTYYGLVSPVDNIIQCVTTIVSGSVDTLDQAIAVQEVDDFGGGGIRGAVKVGVEVTSDDVVSMERVAVREQIREFFSKGGFSQVVLGVGRRTEQSTGGGKFDGER